ncbi:MAG: antitermination regulator, partial [Kribbellaceae bacterium]|nr:antitermination regulator [Kribbellaceae bacterium]
MHDEVMADIERRGSDAEGPASERAAATTGSGRSADLFSRLALEMHEADGVEETVDAVVEFAIQAMNCAYAGVALRTTGGGLEIPAVTDPVVAEL